MVGWTTNLLISVDIIYLLGEIDNTNDTYGYGCELQDESRDKTQTMSRLLVDVLPVNLGAKQC